MGIENEAREVAIAICHEIDEDEAYIVSTQFDTLLRMRGRSAGLTDEGQFEIPSEAITYASLVVTFIGGIFADAAKDALKEQLVDALRRWRAGRLSGAGEASDLQAKLRALIDESKASVEQREKLKEAVKAALKWGGRGNRAEMYVSVFPAMSCVDLTRGPARTPGFGSGANGNSCRSA